MKSIRVSASRAQEIFTVSKAQLAGRFHPDVIATMVEVADGVAANVGDVWDGVTFSAYVTTPGPTDQEKLNRELAQPGSIVRAVAILMFREINKLRVTNGDASYTMEQFVAALEAELA